MAAYVLGEFKTDRRTKPDGGYVQVSTVTAGLLLWGHAKGLLSSRAVRVGLALYELRIRRSAHVWTERKRGHVPEFTPHYSTKELAAFCGLPPKRARAALGELLELGLVAEFSPERIAFARSLAGLTLTTEQVAEFRSWLATVTKRKRFPIPRRALALAAESSGPALIVTIVGACLRCSWLRPGEGFSFSGRLSCGWLARQFGICLRSVRSAKQLLMTLDWLRPNGTISRFGEAVAINPEWHRLASLPEIERENGQDPRAGGGAAGTESAPLESHSGSNSAEVFLIESPLSGKSKHQDERESRGLRPEMGPGVYQPEFETGKTQDPPRGSPPAPRLSCIRPELDFVDVGRALELFRQAVKCGLVPNGSDFMRELWLSAMERARTVPEVANPAGFFLKIIKGRHWDYPSEGQREAARARLHAYLYGKRIGPPILIAASIAKEIPPEIPARARLSKDALLLQVLRGRGVRNLDTVYPSLRAEGWDRPRFVTALAELS